MYSECLSRLSTVGQALLHSEHSTEANRLVMADLDIDHYFLPVEHVWSHKELRPALETLALLHISAETLPLEERSLLMPAPDRRWEIDTRAGAPARLIDWHIAASGMAAFEVASIFFQSYLNHRNLERRAVLGDYLEARQKTDRGAGSLRRRVGGFLLCHRRQRPELSATGGQTATERRDSAGVVEQHAGRHRGESDLVRVPVR